MGGKAMKNLIKSFAAVVTALFALNACTNEQLNPAEPAVTHSVKFVAEPDATKTTASLDYEKDSVYYSWTKEDEGRFCVFEFVDGTLSQMDLNPVASLDSQTGKMSITASFSGPAPVGDVTYAAMLNEAVRPDQTAPAGTYDQQSDILVSEFVDAVPDGTTLLKFRRVNAFALMTVTGIEGESLSAAAITEKTGKLLTAPYNIETQCFDEKLGDGAIWIKAASEISGGQASVFISTLPIEGAALMAGAVTVDETGAFKAAYEKSFANGRSIDFTCGDVRPFNIAMNKVEQNDFDLSTNNTYSLSSAEISWRSGLSRIICEKAGSTSGCDKYVGGIDGNETRFYKNQELSISSIAPIKKVVFEASSTDYATALAGCDWQNATAEKDASGKIVTVTSIDAAKQIYTTIGSAAGVKKISIFYGIHTAHTVTVDDNVENGEISADKTSAVLGEKVTLTADPTDGYVLGSWIVKIDGTEETVPVVDNIFTMPDADVTVSAEFVPDGDVNEPYTIDFTKKGYENAQVVKEVMDIPFVVTFTKGSSDPKYYTADGGSMRFYNGGSMTVTADPGLTITKIEITTLKDGGLALSSPTLSEKTWTGSAQSVTFVANGTNQIQTLTITYTGKTSDVYTVTCGEVDGGTLAASSRRAVAGSVVSLTATADEEYEFNGDWSVKDASENPVDVNDDTFTMPESDVTVSGSFKKKTYEITSVDAEHGSFAVKVGGEVVKTASKGDKVTLEADPDEGYMCTGWTVTKQEGGEVPVSDNSFTMPACEVAIEATFELKPAFNPTGSGTKEDPYTVDDAIALINTLGTGTSATVCVKGAVSHVDSYNGTSKTIQYWLDDNKLEVSSGRNIDNTDFGSIDDLAVGDLVIVQGSLKKFNSTYEFTSGNYIVDIKRAPYLKASADKTDNLAADGETITIDVDTNVDSWSVTSSDGTNFEVGTKTANTVEIIVAKNETGEARSADITISAAGVLDVKINLSQLSGGLPPAGTVMWSETWEGGAVEETPETYGQEGTTVYGDNTVTYSCGGSTNTKLYNDTQMGGDKQINLMLYGASGQKDTWSVAGIPTGGVGKLTLTLQVNNNSKGRCVITTTTPDVEVGEKVYTGDAKPYTISVEITVKGAVSTFNLDFANTNTSSVRLDNICVKVAE